MRVMTSSSSSHFTHQFPDQPGTISRTGAPWMCSRYSPFWAQASSVS